nr:glycoside hydrolase family 38 C-terminal domain-containing protein [Liquorilactobacillus sicerae]
MNKLHLKKDLEVYQGELRLPTYSRVHRTIGSVRSQLKRKNFKLERIILRRVEPLMVIAQKSGIKISNGPVLKLWKKLLECQPHDTLGGSVSDNVAVDIEHRFKEGFEIANGIENYIKKRIAQRLELKENQVLIFNTDPIRFNGFKTIKIITSSKRIKFDSEYSACVISEKYFPARKNIMQQTPKGFEFKTESEYYELTVQIKVSLPGLGFKVIDFKNSDKTIACLETNNGNLIQNEYWKLNFHEGQFDLNSKQYQYTNFIKILDSGNDGDTYDYSPLRSDFERELSLNGKCKIIKSQNFQELVIHGSWKLPATLTDRIIKNPKLKVVDYVLKLKLTNHQKIIDGNLKIDNQILSHRLRLKIKTGIMSNYSVSEIHGAFVKHKNYPIDSHWDQEFVEKPVNIYNFDQAVGLKNENHSLFFLGKGMKEYEKVEDSLLVTLMSTTGQLGKPNLLWRPGRASGDTTSVGHLMTPTILAQEVGTNDFTFGILENSSEEDENKIANKIHSWFSQSISYQIQNLNLFVNRLDNKIWNIEFKNDLPRINEMSEFLNLKIPLVVVAIYPAYTIEKAFVIRLANYSNHKVDLACLKDESFYVSDALEKIDPTADYSVKAENMITLIKKY